MNRQDFETWLKELADKQEFEPNETGWEQMQKALAGDVDNKKKVFPIWARRSAGLAASLLLGFLAILGIRQKERSGPGPDRFKTTMTIPLPLDGGQSFTAEPEPEPMEKPIPDVITRCPNTPIAASVLLFDDHAPTYPEQPARPDIKNPPQDRQDGHERPQTIKERPGSANRQGGDLRQLVLEGPKEKKDIHWGLSADMGKPNIGPLAYQFSVSGRSDIHAVFFVEAGLDLSATQVSYSSDYSFPGLTLTDNFSNGALESKTVHTQYAGHVMALGCTPAIGLRPYSHVSVSVGASISKNLNPELALGGNQDLDAQIMEKSIIPMGQSVSDWNIGLNATADVSLLSDQLFIRLRYQHGLNTYLWQNGTPRYLNGFNIGLKCMLGK